LQHPRQRLGNVEIVVHHQRSLHLHRGRRWTCGTGRRLPVRLGSTLAGNTASDSGGGIYNLGAATVEESTLSTNTATSAGGGTFNADSGTLTIDNSDVRDNLALLGADLYTLGKATFHDSTVGIIGP
jgi:hypothetical protein